VRSNLSFFEERRFENRILIARSAVQRCA